MFKTLTTVLVKEQESFSSDRSKITGLTGEIDVVSTVFFGSVFTGIDVSGAMPESVIVRRTGKRFVQRNSLLGRGFSFKVL